ncbi:Radical SAM superfamily protein [Enhygromyxa salina]|uniref:Radical SAM superfamily protein n=1 Tax=Enhygromyxa salina TaxID=215803 RepID=A0A2S9XJY9_9BACT|nr:radical SAM protein [Enhygromyxa salina]PRP93050.1 Radical SAM superfamily protein [Enhygromyxa salina]
MDLRDYLLALMEPLAPGDELEPGLRFTGASTELGLRLSFLVEERDEVHVEVGPRELGLKYAARSERLSFAYRDGGADHVDQKLGFRVCQTVAAHVGAREAEVLSRLALDVEAKAEQAEGSARIRELHGTRLLELAGVPGERFYTLSPYLGCLIGCRFCYAQSRLDPMRALLRLPQIPWGSYVDVRVNAPELLERELRELPRHVIKFCPIVSDPYQAVEKRFELTRGCLEVIARADDPPPTLIMTRSTMILRDLELLRSIPHAWVGASIPTLDDSVRKHFEPRAASVPERLDMLRQFKRAGVQRCVVVQPMLPGDPIALADALADVVESVSIGVLRGEMGAEQDFADPRFAHARGEDWQRREAFALRDALEERGVSVWVSELPPPIAKWRPAAAQA